MKARRLGAVLAVAGVLSGLGVLAAPEAMAHPLGNFTRNTYVGLAVSESRFTVDHVLDLAEVPTFQERTAMDTDGDGQVSNGEATAWAQTQCATSADGIAVTTASGPVSWSTRGASVTFPGGEGGLPTTRLECQFSAPTSGSTAATVTLSLENGRAGWHELTVTGNGLRVASDVPESSVTDRLRSYPADASPLDVRTAELSWGPASGGQGVTAGNGAGGEPADVPAAVPAESGTETTDANAAAGLTALAPRGLDTLSQRFTDLVSAQDITLGFGVLAVAIAIFLGGLHALAPGHGKTLMAASLVGTSGRRRDAVVLGASVTAAHTTGVVLLALILSVWSTVAPERAYPYLGLAAASLAMGVGVSLFRQARRGGSALHGHSHGHGHGQGQGQGHSHSHGPFGHQHSHDHGSGGPAPQDNQPHRHEPHRHEPHGHPHDDGHGHAHADELVTHTHATVTLAPPATKLAQIVAPTDSPPDSATEPTPVAATRTPTSRIVALGLAGGLVPSPSAILVLLAGFALGRSWFALLLVVAYGVGMALTLCLTGLVLVRAGSLGRRVAASTATPGPVTYVLARLPLLAACTVMTAGLWLAIRSLLAL